MPIQRTIAPLLAATLCLLGCGSSSSGSGECFDYGSFAGSSPAVHFRADVVPIFKTSCGGPTGTCHSDEAPLSPAQHFYGPLNLDPSDAQIDEIFAQAVGKASVDEPAMDVVKPSDPEHSFLTYKLDGLDCSTLKCASGASSTCGQTMPQGGAQLSADERDTIRRWIAQGAKND